MIRWAFPGGAALALLLGGTAAAQTGGGALVLKGRLIDGTGAPPVEGAVVVVEGGRIACAGPADRCPVPAGARVVDAAGGTILPGLIDLHVHVGSPEVLSMFLPAGVTAVRDLHATFESLAVLDGVEAPKPRLFRAGPLIDGRDLGWPGAAVAKTPAAARAVVDSILGRGVDFIKLYNGLAPEVFFAAAARARERGARVTADLFGSEVDALEALEAGVEGFEHAAGFLEAYRRLGGDPAAGPPDAALLDTLARAVVRRGAYVVPTLIVQHQYAAVQRPSLDGVPLADRVPEPIRAFWRRGDAAPPALKRRFAENERFAKALVRRIHELGGRIGAGSDLPNPYVTPGGGLHQELELLVEAGLAPLEAIRAATGGAAGILGRDDLGVVAPGRAADLVVVAGNPAEEIRATRDVRWVVRAGRLLPIDTLLALAPPPAGAEPAKGAAPPAPAPDPGRLAPGAVAYDVLLNGRPAGVDTVRLERAGGTFVLAQRTRTEVMRLDAEVELRAATLEPIAVGVVQEAFGSRVEIELAVRDARMAGKLVMPPEFGGTLEVDVPFPAGSYEATSLAQVIAALPLAPGNAWSLPVYNSYARAVAPYRVEIGEAEAVDVGGTAVRAYRVGVETSGFRQTLWISEAAPRWVVASEIPAFGLRAVAKGPPR